MKITYEHIELEVASLHGLEYTEQLDKLQDLNCLLWTARKFCDAIDSNGTFELFQALIAMLDLLYNNYTEDFSTAKLIQLFKDKTQNYRNYR